MTNIIDYKQVASDLEQLRVQIIQTEKTDDIIDLIKKVIDYAKNIPVKDIGIGNNLVSKKEEIKQTDIKNLNSIIERIKQNLYNSEERMYIDISLIISGLIINITHLPTSEILD